MRIRFALLALGAFTPSLAGAQEPQEPSQATVDPPADQQTAPESTTADTGSPEPVTSEPQPSTNAAPVLIPEYNQAEAEPVPPEAKPTARGPQKQMSIYMGSPIWLTNSPLDPGFEVEVRSGLKIQSWVPEVGVGARWNWFNVDKLREQFPTIIAPNQFAGENLTGIWVSLGVRFEPELKNSKIQPYVSLAFDANLWGFSYETTEICGFWSCGTVREYDFAPGFSSRVGIRIQPNPAIGIDLGAKPAMTFQGWAFQSTHAWIEPYAGLTVLMGARR